MAKFFITGGSGFIGSSITKELISRGHKVSALSRSPASTEKIKSISDSVEIIDGSIKDFEIIKKAINDSDGLFHLAYDTDLTKGPESAQTETELINAIASVLKGKVFVYTSILVPYVQLLKDSSNTLISEDLKVDNSKIFFGLPRIKNEQLALSLADQGVKVNAVRLSPAYGENDSSFFAAYVKISLKAGFVGVPAEVENNLWPTVEKTDAARLFVEVALKGKSGVSYHAFAENVKVSEIAEAIAKKHSIPVKRLPAAEMSEVYGILGQILALNAPASSKITQTELGWNPTGPTLQKAIAEFY